MKIYFAGSIRAGRQDADVYRQLINRLQEFCQVLTEHVGTDLPSTGENIPSVDIYERDRGWIDEADIVVAEVTQPSTGVGYEIGYAETHGKPVYCLYRQGAERRISAMVEGNPYCTILRYTDPDEVTDRLKKLLEN
jgi:2'-deoxynucleoside 5'-phosphate N-hydrolase